MQLSSPEPGLLQSLLPLGLSEEFSGMTARTLLR